MNKLFRLSISLFLAGLLLGVLLHFMKSASQVLANQDFSLRSEMEKNHTPEADNPQANLIVTTLYDELNSDGDCSLREAIEAANTNTSVDACGTGDVFTDTITFDVAGTITVTSQLSVTAGGPLVIEGGDVITTSGGGTTRVWWVETGSELIIQNLNIISGRVEGDGAGIYSNSASVTLHRSKLMGNRFIGDIVYGGGMYSFNGELNIIESTFENNGLDNPITGRGFGGGLAIQGSYGEIKNTVFISNTAFGECDMFYIPGGGGVYFSSSIFDVKDSSFISNQEFCGGGGIANTGSSTLTITNSTFFDNKSSMGGGINNELSTLTIYNSTFSGNLKLSGYGGVGAGIAQWFGTMTIFNSTISGNSSDEASGVFFANDGGTFINTIIANNFGGDCGGIITDGGHNISSDDSCGFDPANGSMPNTDPLLGPLQDNGGPTLTHALLSGSPAIDEGDNAQCPPTDQRGITRPIDGDKDGNPVCDIGAYEFEQAISLQPLNQSGDGTPGETIEHTLILINYTDLIDTYSLVLGMHGWDSSLSTNQLGPVEPGTSQPFTITVTIPENARWYLTDTVVVTATSITSPTEYTASAQVTSQAYAPPQISISPLNLVSTQAIDQIISQPITISNGEGVTLTYEAVIQSVEGSVLMLHLNEPPGSTTFYDSSGYENHGNCNQDTCPEAGIDGHEGTSVEFDGNDFITVADTPELNPENAISFSAWIFPFDWDDNHRILQKGYSDNQYIFGCWATVPGQLQLKLAGVGILNTTLPTPGTWHHVVGLYDGTKMQIWEDGYLIGQTTATGLIATTTDPLFIGTKWFGAPPSDFFNGRMDEVAIYNFALTPAQILRLFSAGPPSDWLSVNPFTGTVSTDSSLPVTVTFDSTDIQPAIYTTTLAIFSNDPVNPIVNTPITLTVINPVTPTEITILGPENGRIRNPYAFIAIVEPISSTLPLTYAWQSTGQETITHTGGLSDTIDFIWEMPGAKVITVTASNPAGTVVDTHLITITAPLYDLYLPLVIKSSEEPIGYLPPFLLLGSGVFTGAIFIGVARKRHKLSQKF